MYKYVFFDMDGTVLDTLQDLTDAVNFSLKNFGFPLVNEDKTRHNLGNGSRYLLEHSLPDNTDSAVLENVLAFYLSYYQSHCRINTAPYSGVIELMNSLKAEGIKMAVVSNKPDAAVKNLSKEFFQDVLAVSIGESPEIRRKPSPDTVIYAMKLLGAVPEESVYIGDTEVDIITANNAGIDCIIVSWGFRTFDELRTAGAKVIAQNIEELKELILLG